MRLHLPILTVIGAAVCCALAGDPPGNDPAPSPKPDAQPATPSAGDNKITVEVEENGRKILKVIDLSDPASAASIMGKAVITTEINGKRETRIVDLKDADKFLPAPIFGERPPVRTGPVTFLGVAAIELPHEVSAQLPLPPDTGLQVGAIAPDSPAAASGLLESDVLFRLDDQILITQRQLAVLIANHKEGDKVRVTYFRKGQQMETTAVLGKREAPTPMENTAPYSTVTRRVLRFGDGTAADEDSLRTALEHVPAELRPSLEKAIRDSAGKPNPEPEQPAETPADSTPATPKSP